MAAPFHPPDTLGKACIPKGDRTVIVIEKLINDLSLLKPCQRPVLP